jgi:hypothetical protein
MVASRSSCSLSVGALLHRLVNVLLQLFQVLVVFVRAWSNVWAPEDKVRSEVIVNYVVEIGKDFDLNLDEGVPKWLLAPFEVRDLSRESERRMERASSLDVSHALSIYIINGHQHVERDEEHDTVLHARARRQHNQVYKLSQQTSRALHQTHQVDDELVVKLFRVQIQVLDHCDALSHVFHELHVQQIRSQQSCSDYINVWRVDLEVLVIVDDCQVDNSNQRDLHKEDKHAGIKVTRLLCR